jgi:hypothetical protein
MCSVELPEHANFCANCGARVDAETDVPLGDASTENDIGHGLSVAALGKGFQEKVDGYNDAVTVEMRFQNTGNKNIKAFKGSLEVFDLFETRIIGLAFQIQEPLRSGATKTDTILWEYNQFREDHQRLRFTEWDYLVVKSKVLAVIFEDGTKISG